MECKASVRDEPTVNKVFVCSQFFPDFLSPQANLLDKSICDPQSLKLNSLGCCFMLMAADTGSKCWMLPHKERKRPHVRYCQKLTQTHLLLDFTQSKLLRQHNAYDTEFKSCGISNFQNVAPAELGPEETLATNVSTNIIISDRGPLCLGNLSVKGRLVCSFLSESPICHSLYLCNILSSLSTHSLPWCPV